MAEPPTVGRQWGEGPEGAAECTVLSPARRACKKTMSREFLEQIFTWLWLRANPSECCHTRGQRQPRPWQPGDSVWEGPLQGQEPRAKPTLPWSSRGVPPHKAEVGIGKGALTPHPPTGDHLPEPQASLCSRSRVGGRGVRVRKRASVSPGDGQAAASRGGTRQAARGPQGRDACAEADHLHPEHRVDHESPLRCVEGGR